MSLDRSVPFRPQVDEQLIIDDVTYRLAEHPSAPGMIYGQRGRAATVYLLASGFDSRALKVFVPRFRTPFLVTVAERIRPYADLPGLQVCQRTVLVPQQHGTLLRKHRDLVYAVLMPWIEGPTWQEVMVSKRDLTSEESLASARLLTETLAIMEQRGMAHCDLSGPNVVLPSLAGGKDIELVDVEGMHGPGLERPREILSNSPGYGHKTALEGIWGPESDRFAGAMLLAEMLGWCDERVREAGLGDPGYFAQEDVQQDAERYHILATVLQEQWGTEAAELFERAWHSETLWGCPTFGEWLVALPEKVSAPRPAPEEAEARQKETGEAGEATVRELTDLARQFEEDGQLAAALQTYRRAQALVSQENGLARELAHIVQDLEVRLSPRETEEVELANLFDEGSAAYRRGEWAGAKELLAEVARRRREFARGGQQATELLAQAERRLSRPRGRVPDWVWALVMMAVLLLGGGGLVWGLARQGEGPLIALLATLTPTVIPTATSAPTATPTRAPAPTTTPTATPRRTPTATPTVTPHTPTPTATPSATLVQVQTTPTPEMQFGELVVGSLTTKAGEPILPGSEIENDTRLYYKVQNLGELSFYFTYPNPGIEVSKPGHEKTYVQTKYPSSLTRPYATTHVVVPGWGWPSWVEGEVTLRPALCVSTQWVHDFGDCEWHVGPSVQVKILSR